MADRDVVMKIHAADELQHLTIHTFWSALLLSGLYAFGLNNYIVIQVIQIIAYFAVVTDKRFEVYERLPILGILVRMVVAVYMFGVTTILLQHELCRDKKGDILQVGFDEDDHYPNIPTWYFLRLVTCIQTLIWAQFLSLIRLISLILRLLVEKMHQYNIRNRAVK